jgi:plastocyanin
MKASPALLYRVARVQPLLVIAAAVLALPLLAACGYSGASDQEVSASSAPQAGQGSDAASRTAFDGNIAIQGYAFQPVEIQAAPGTTVTWTNRDAVAHTVSARGGEWGSGLLPQGQQFSHTFTEPGTYDYFCQPHPWMVGRIVVGQATVAAASPAASPPATDNWAEQMRRWMEEIKGAGSFEAMLQWMKEHGGSGMMGSDGMMNGGMMGSQGPGGQ